MTVLQAGITAGFLAVVAAGAANAAVVTGTSGTFGDIPDGDPAGVSLAISVTEQLTITDLNLTVSDLQTTFVGDITIRLVSPSGTALNVIDRLADSSNLGGTYTFDDQASLSFAAALDALSPTEVLASGSYSAGALSVFNGEQSDGDWSVTISDNFAIDSASAGTATLNITGFPEDNGMAPIPLPAGMPLLALGLGALGLMRRRRD